MQTTVLRTWIAALIYSISGAEGANPNLPLDRAFTLKNHAPFLLERELGTLASDTGRVLGFAFPRPCVSPRDGSHPCESPGGLIARDPHDGTLSFSPLIAEESRPGLDGALSTEAGAIVTGGKGPVSFRADSRIFVELDRDKYAPPFDREDVDHQTDSVTGAISYSSYARYRGDFDLDLPFGRFTAARDALHWGPGLHTNLVFHQDAIPFHYLSYSGNIGPVSVTTVYGKLLIGSSAAFSSENHNDRNLFAHRYELGLGRNWLIGISEQMILYNDDNAFLFVPVFPLFIAKGLIYEESNNGNLSFDITRRMPGLGLLYGEFLLDDLESPSSLLTRDYVQNKWAVMAGTHLTRRFSGADLGLILEYSRIEPWVYTHFESGTSQTANMGHALGNQAGPNSQTAVAKIYARVGGNWYFSLRAQGDWKGRGAGSEINDPSPVDPLAPKNFLGDDFDRTIGVTPLVSYVRSWVSAELSGTAGDNPALTARVAMRY